MPLTLAQLPLPASREGSVLLDRAAQAAERGNEASSAALLRPLLTHNLSPEMEIRARRLLMRDERALFHYRAALDAIAPLIRNGADNGALRNQARLLAALADAPPQTVSGPDLRVSAASVLGRVDGAAVPFVIDTGASFSVLTRSAAKAARLVIQHADYAIQSADGVSIRADIAIGNLTVRGMSWRNVVFLVVPDNSLPSSHHQRRFGLLGLPELRSAGRIQFTSSRQRDDTGEDAPLRLSSGQLTIDTVFNEKRIHCALDSGANRTALYAAFWDRFGTRLLPSRRRISVRTVSGLSTAQHQTPLMLSIAGRSVRLSHAVLFKHRDNNPACVLGADALTALAPATLDFQAMVLKAE